MAEHTWQPSRRGRQLLSMDLSADDICTPIPQQASAIPQLSAANAVPAQRLSSQATHSSHRASSDAFPLRHVEDRTSSLTSVTSGLPQASICPAPTSSTPTAPPRDAAPSVHAPSLHAPRAIPGAQSSIPLGPIRQPLQGGVPSPFYLARARAQAPLQQTQQAQSGWNANQLLQSQQKLQQTLTAARGVGYCQGLRRTSVQRQASLTFSRRLSSSQKPAQHQHDHSGRHASVSDSMSAHLASGQKRSNEAAGLAQSPSKRHRLVHIAQPQHSGPSQGPVKFKCCIGDILDAHWPAAADQEGARQSTAQVPSTACSLGIGSQSSSGPQVMPAASASAQAVPNGSGFNSLGRGSTCCLPLCDADASSTFPLPAATADAMAASTAAFESLTIGAGPETHARRAMPPPHLAPAHAVQGGVAAAPGAGRTLQTSFRSSLTQPQPHVRSGSAAITLPPANESSRSQPGVQPHVPSFALSSFPQVMNQLLSEPSMHVMQAWVAAYQPPILSSSQQDLLPATQSASRPQKRARKGADGQQALAARPDRASAAAAAAASAASMFGKLPAPQLPQLSSIQLLHLRAQQHVAHANASSASFPAAASILNSHAPLGGGPTQPRLQAGGVQPQPLALDLTPSWGFPQLPADLQPPPFGGAHSLGQGGMSQPHSVKHDPPHGPPKTQHVYTPTGLRPGADETMHALLARLSQERNANLALPSLSAAAPPTPTHACSLSPPPAAPSPPACGLASLTLVDGRAAHATLASPSLHHQPHSDSGAWQDS